MKPIRWTDEHTAMALKLHKAGANDEACIAAIGRTRAAINTRVHWVKTARIREAAAAENEAERRSDDQRALDRAADAQRRLLAPRTITAALCGDPPPGHSALDQRLAARDRNRARISAIAHPERGA